MRWLVLTLGLLAMSCSGDDSPELAGKIGGACVSCPDDCGLIFDMCDCQTCISFGYDAEEQQLLRCNNNTWELLRECPGSAFARCTSHNGYKLECLDENGNDVPPLDP